MNTQPYSFKIQQFKNIESASEELSKKWESLTKQDLVIFDIDGVLLTWPFSLHTVFFTFKSSKIKAFKKIIQNTSAWIFTDRPNIIYKPLENQIINALKNGNNSEVAIFPNKTAMHSQIGFNTPHRAIIYNAAKRSTMAESIVIKAIENFDNIYYIAGQDLPFHYEDYELLKRVEETYRIDMSKLTFLDIRKKWFQR